MPRCEKCGYPRATIEWCTSCGSKDPYPKRKWLLRGSLAASLILVFVISVFFSFQAAKERVRRTKAEAGSFRAEREVKIVEMPPGKR